MFVRINTPPDWVGLVFCLLLLAYLSISLFFNIRKRVRIRRTFERMFRDFLDDVGVVGYDKAEEMFFEKLKRLDAG